MPGMDLEDWGRGFGVVSREDAEEGEAELRLKVERE